METQPLSIPAVFEEFHSLPDFQKTYRTAVEVAHLDDHPALASRPLRVVDFAGGAGLLYPYLAEYFKGVENSFSYTNIDLDADRLSQSPGRRIHGDLSFLTLAEFPPNPDCIFSLFSAPVTPTVTTKAYKQFIKLAEVFQVARTLGNDGRYIVAGQYSEGFIDWLQRHFDEYQTGITGYSHERLTLSPKSAATLLDFDLNTLPNNKRRADNTSRKEDILNYQQVSVVGFKRDRPAQDINKLNKNLRLLQAIILAEGRIPRRLDALHRWI